MGSAIFSTAVSGLGAAQSNLQTISNNISNVNTAGYHRQVVEQNERSPFFEGFGYTGRGVDTAQVNRVYDQYLDARLSSVTSANSFYQTQGALMSQLDNMVGSNANGLSPAMQNFFQSMQTLSSTPTSIPARQAVLNSAQAMVGQVQAMSNQLTQVRTNVNGQVQSTIDNINAYATQIGNLNTQILALSQGNSRLPNDVLDQRDQLVQKLSEMVNVSVVTQSDGSYGVFIGNGQSLVLGATVNKLVAVPSAADPQQLTTAYSTGGVSTVIPETLISGGQLGGLFAFRTTALNRTEADLGSLAISISDSVNRQYRVGRDLNNKPVTANISNPALGQFFGDLSGIQTSLNNAALTAPAQVALLRQASQQFSLVINDPALITTASSLKANSSVTMTAAKLLTTSGGANTGTMAVTASQSTVGAFSPVPPVVVTNTGPGTFTATGGYTVAVSGNNLTLTNANGVTVKLLTAGAPTGPTNANVGDTFSIGTSNTGALTTTSASMVAGTLTAPITVTNTGVGTYSATNGFTVAQVGAVLTLTNSNGVTVRVNTAGVAGLNDQFTVGAANVGQAFISSVSQVAGVTPTVAGPPVPPAPLGPTPPTATWGPLTLTYNAATQTFTATSTVVPATTYTVTPSPNVAGAFQVVDNTAVNGFTMQFQVSGTPANGDTFVIDQKALSPAATAAQIAADNSQTDNSNLRAIDALQTQNTIINTPSGGASYVPVGGSVPNTTFQTFFGQAVSFIGSTANTIKASTDSQATALNQIKQVQQSFSGVNLDEEAASLIKFQQAYQASSKVIQMAQQIFNSLLQL